MKILITGGAGFVMRAALERLAPLARVIAADLVDAAPAGLGAAAYRRLDVLDREAVRSVLLEERPDVVVHAATITQAAEGELAGAGRFVGVNVVGSANVAQACVEAGVGRLVCISSGSVYGPSVRARGIPVDAVDTLPEPNDLYALTKLGGELLAARICELGGVRNPRLRLSNVYGDGERPTGSRLVMSVPTMLAEASAGGRPLAITTRTLDAESDWISARDVAAAVEAACFAESAGDRAYNVACGATTSVRRVLELSGASARIVADGSHDADIDMNPDGSSAAHGSDLGYVVDDTLADLGWRARPVEQQLSEFGEAVRARGAKAASLSRTERTE